MSPMQQMLLGSGSAVASMTYVDDVFSIYTYGSENMGSSDADISINNAIDLASDGGLVWIKRYKGGNNHILADTENGGNKYLSTNNNSGVTTDSNMFKTFNSNGFTVGTEDPVNKWDNNPDDRGRYVSYTWKKTAGFFDVVKYQGNSGTAFNVSHSLGVKPGAILIKSLDSSGDWYWWSKGMTTSQWLKFNKKETVQTSSAYQIGANLTSTTFQVPTGSEVNNGSDNFIAYLWADGDESAAQIFGESGDKTLMKMGTYTGTGSSIKNNVNIGFEPQWLIIRRFDAGEAENWEMVDSMRGWSDQNSEFLQANTTRQQADEPDKIRLTGTGFEWLSGGSDWNAGNGVYLYMAFRRSDGYVQKPVEDPTKVFAMDTGNASSVIPTFDSGFPVDFALTKITDSSGNWTANGRLTGISFTRPNTDGAQSNYSGFLSDSNVGYGAADLWDSSYQAWLWKRSAGFDVQCYTGNRTGLYSGQQSIAHSLNKNVEMAWIKKRSGSDTRWVVYHKDLGTLANNSTYPYAYQHNLTLNENYVADIATSRFDAPTSTHFTVKSHETVNENGEEYVMMLFASISGISSIGSYNGSSSSQTITTGFQPRFVIIRRTNTEQDWVVLDTLRGWASGNDPRLELNNDSTENNNTNFGAPISTGFTLEGGVVKSNDSGGKYVYYCHA